MPEREGKCRAFRVTAHAITLLLRIVFLASARAVVTDTEHVNVKDATNNLCAPEPTLVKGKLGLDGINIITRSLKPQADERMMCDADLEFPFAACERLFEYLNPATYNAMPKWLGCPSSARLILAVGVECQLEKKMDVVLDGGSTYASGWTPIPGTKQTLLELGQFDTNQKCTNGGEVANEGTELVQRFCPADGHRLLDEFGNAAKRTPRDSLRFWQKVCRIVDKTPISASDITHSVNNLLAQYGTPTTETKHRYILIGNHIKAADMPALDTHMQTNGYATLTARYTIVDTLAQYRESYTQKPGSETLQISSSITVLIELEKESLLIEMYQHKHSDLKRLSGVAGTPSAKLTHLFGIHNATKQYDSYTPSSSNG
jgi:hypothetical protein